MLARRAPLPAAVLVAGLLLAGCSGGDAADDAADVPVDTPASVTGFGSGAAERGDAQREADAEEVSEAPEPAGDAPAEETPAGDGPGGGQPQDGESLPLPQPAPGDRVIKEGTVTVEVESFDAAFRAVVDTAVRLGGTVVSSSSSTEDHGTSGSVTVRVPVDEYGGLLTGVNDIGEVVERNITAQDVTTEYTDLESRLRHLRAQERFYLELLEEAETVADAVTLRQQLDGLQADIEQVRGRLQLLDARTAYSTLTVELLEPGAPLVTGASGARPTLAEYWERARDAFTNVVGVMLVTVFFLAPLALPGALAYALWRSVRPRSAPAIAEVE